MEWIRGVDNHLPDFLSRANVIDTVDTQLHVTEVSSSVNWTKEQSLDDEIKAVINALKSNSSRDEWFKLVNGRRWFAESSSLFINNDILCHSKNKIVCPVKMKALVLDTHHDLPGGGHRSGKTTYESVRDKYFWFNMRTDVINHCGTCNRCQMFNYANKHNVAPMKSIKIATRPMQLLGADFMVPFRVSRNGNKYIMLVIYHWTKFAFGVALPTMCAEATAKVLLDKVVGPFGMFENILTDQGANFESKLIKQLCALLGATKLHTFDLNQMVENDVIDDWLREAMNITFEINELGNDITTGNISSDSSSDWDELDAFALN
jgi:hypothetical protein